jgi:4-hydroxy-tetrahydrodipicolinate reductase
MTSERRVIIVGAGGRMGLALTRGLLRKSVPGLRLAGAVDLWDCPLRGQDAGLAAGAGEAGVPIGTDLAALAGQADVVVDFSGPRGTAGNAPRCADWGLPMVVGTTGLDAEGTAALSAAARKVAVVHAPNMSLGINLLLALTRQAAEVLRGRGYDVEILERHHRHKKDAPSGTALALGREAAGGMGWSLPDVERHGREGISKTDRPEKEIGFHAIRGGDFVGDHTVLFATEGECIELSHRATHRDTLARGALLAAAWVPGRPAGLYSMRDVLGLA